MLSVLVALLHRGVEQWLREYERLAASTVELVRHVLVQRAPLVVLHLADGPRRRFGLAFESRPPPLPA